MSKNHFGKEILLVLVYHIVSSLLCWREWKVMSACFRPVPESANFNPTRVLKFLELNFNWLRILPNLNWVCFSFVQITGRSLMFVNHSLKSCSASLEHPLKCLQYLNYNSERNEGQKDKVCKWSCFSINVVDHFILLIFFCFCFFLACFALMNMTLASCPHIHAAYLCHLCPFHV